MSDCRVTLTQGARPPCSRINPRNDGQADCYEGINRGDRQIRGVFPRFDTAPRSLRAGPGSPARRGAGADNRNGGRLLEEITEVESGKRNDRPGSVFRRHAVSRMKVSSTFWGRLAAGFAPAQPDFLAASMRDFLSGGYTVCKTHRSKIQEFVGAKTSSGTITSHLVRCRVLRKDSSESLSRLSTTAIT